MHVALLPLVQHKQRRYDWIFVEADGMEEDNRYVTTNKKDGYRQRNVRQFLQQA